MAEERARPYAIVEEVVGDTFNETYTALQRLDGPKNADAFFAGAVLANLLLGDPLLHDAAQAILLTSADDNPRADAILQEIHRRIRAQAPGGIQRVSQAETDACQ